MTVRMKRIAAQLVLALVSSFLLAIVSSTVSEPSLVAPTDSPAVSRPVGAVLPPVSWRHLP